MKLIKKYGIHIFWGLLFLDCLLINFKGAIFYRLYTKPLLLIILGAYFYINTKKSKHWKSKSLVYFGLFFSWLSDCFFLFQSFVSAQHIENISADTFLKLSLISMLVSFSFYGIIFKRIKAINIKDCQEAFLTFLAMLIACIFYFKEVNKEDDFAKFKFIVLGAFVVLTFMITYSANIYKDLQRRNLTLKYFVPGCIVLVIATAIMMGYRLYLRDAEFLPIVIGLTTGFGQMLMYRGFTKYLKA